MGPHEREAAGVLAAFLVVFGAVAFVAVRWLLA